MMNSRPGQCTRCAMGFLEAARGGACAISACWAGATHGQRGQRRDGIFYKTSVGEDPREAEVGTCIQGA